MSEDRIAGPGADIRRSTLDDLRDFAAKLFAAKPAVRSVMLTVSQYWSDEADDAVHASLVVSERETPLWPHDCGTAGFWERDQEGAVERPWHPLPGESCEQCGDDIDYLPFDDNGSAIDGFEMFCSESGSQDECTAHNTRPYAIARRGAGDAVAIEIVGVCRREVARGEVDPPAAHDARGAELFAQVCAHASELAPRQVLADHLQQIGDPRGEWLALECAAALSPDATARRDELRARHREAALHPLARVIAPDGAELDRGFVRACAVRAMSPEDAVAVRGARAWGTVERLRYLPTEDHPNPHAMLDREMVALRELWWPAIADFDVLRAAPWPLEVLAIDAALVDELLSVPSLPALRHLIVRGDLQGGDLDALARTPLLARLAQLTIATPVELALEPLLAFDIPRVGWVGGADELGEPGGWQATIVRAASTVELSLAGWSPTADLDGLVALARTWRERGYAIALAPSRAFVPAPGDLAWLDDVLTRTAP